MLEIETKQLLQDDGDYPQAVCCSFRLPILGVDLGDSPCLENAWSETADQHQRKVPQHHGRSQKFLYQEQPICESKFTYCTRKRLFLRRVINNKILTTRPARV